MHKINAIKEIIEREGGYVNHPADKGGPTKFGVTEVKAREHGYQGNMENYPIEYAIAVYDVDFWQRLNLDSIAEINPVLALRLFDFGVNSGTTRAGKHLQRLLNVLNNKGQYYPDIKVDGAVGKNTLIALSDFKRNRGNNGLRVLSESLNSLRIAFCVGISENNESQETFTFGWLSRVIEL